MFDALPLKGEFNGSLWTMPVEVRMYIYVAVLWTAFALLPALRPKGMRFVSVAAVALFFVIVLRGRFSEGAFNGANIRMFMYLYGSALFLWRDRVPMGAGILVALVAALVAASFDRTVFLIVYLLAMAPFVLHLAYVPGGRIRRFNELGDYSYGVYIYAFPIQQTLALLFPAMTLAAMMASSAAVSIAVAIVSWKLIEERALEPQGRLRRRDQAAVQLRPRQDRHGGALTSAPTPGKPAAALNPFAHVRPAPIRLTQTPTIYRLTGAERRHRISRPWLER